MAALVILTANLDEFWCILPYWQHSDQKIWNLQQNSGHDFDRWIDNRRGVLEEFQNNLVSSVEIWHLKNSVSRDGFRWNSFRNYFNSLFPLASKAWWFVVVETLIFSWRLSVGRLNFQFSNNVDVHFHVKWGLWSCDIKPCSSTYMYSRAVQDQKIRYFEAQIFCSITGQ